MVVRKHPLILVGSLIPYAILDYLPYLLPALGRFLETASAANVVGWIDILSFENPWTRFIIGIYWLFVWMGAFGTFINFYLDQWYITTERIVDIDQKDFWHRQVSTLLLTRVEDVETNISGLFDTLFGFGTISVETAGAEPGRFKMPGLSRPREVRDLILKEAARSRREENIGVEPKA